MDITIAKLCYVNKQHFASRLPETGKMEKKSINHVLAEALRAHMEERGLTQKALADAAGIGQTTVGLYLNPDRRQKGKSDKPPSAKLAEIEAMASALKIEVWELLRPTDSSRLAFILKMEEAFAALPKPTAEPASPVSPEPTPTPTPSNRVSQARRQRRASGAAKSKRAA